MIILDELMDNFEDPISSLDGRVVLLEKIEKETFTFLNNFVIL